MKFYLMDWRGPYTYDEAIHDTTLENGLYAITGIRKNKINNKKNIKLQYIGKTKTTLGTRFNDKSHYVHQVNRELGIWFGKIRNKRVDDLLFIEHMFIRFSPEKDKFNKQNKERLPTESGVVISNFFNKEMNRQYIRLPPPVRCIPEVIIWDQKMNEEVFRYTKRLQIESVKQQE
ncbi:MAG: hypothetical protein HDQ89_10240 [Desulfovibrio sp.]|nr:hypothetical protein [Desulfovibrio sp.]